jgi:membrane protease YdiL (CAAX protease family)
MVANPLITLKKLVTDGPFIAALIAGPVFWGALWLSELTILEWGGSVSNLSHFLLLVLIYPILEEIVFRGALQGWLRSLSWGTTHWGKITVANLATSIVFTLAHLSINPVLLSAAVFIPSLVFGYFRDRFGRLHASIILHIFYNAGFIWLFAGSLVA